MKQLLQKLKLSIEDMRSILPSSMNNSQVHLLCGKIQLFFKRVKVVKIEQYTN